MVEGTRGSYKGEASKRSSIKNDVEQNVCIDGSRERESEKEREREREVEISERSSWEATCYRLGGG